MTALHFADSGEAADLAAFLGRLLHYDKAASVRLQVHGTTVAVFGRPPFDVLAVRTARLASEVAPDGHSGTGRAENSVRAENSGRAESGRAGSSSGAGGGPAGTAAAAAPRAAAAETVVDATVSAGQLLDAVDEEAAAVTLPPTVTGPPWTGMLPPRGGWRRVSAADLPLESVRSAVARGVAEFRARTEQLPQDGRTRAELDRIAAEIWSRPLGLPGAGDLPLRAVHAAQALGFLRPARVTEPSTAAAGAGGAAGVPGGVAVLASGAWLRAATPCGSVVVRRGGGVGLPLTPLL